MSEQRTNQTSRGLFHFSLFTFLPSKIHSAREKRHQRRSLHCQCFKLIQKVFRADLFLGQVRHDDEIFALQVFGERVIWFIGLGYALQ